MNLYRSCPHCQHEAHSIHFADNRVDLAMSKGEQIEYSCPKCGQAHSFSVDELYRKPSKWILAVAMLIFVLGVPIAWNLMSYEHIGGQNTTYVLSGLTIAPVMVYLILKDGDKKRVARFNEHYFKMK